MSAADDYRAAKRAHCLACWPDMCVCGLGDAVRALIAEGVRIGNGYKQGRFVEEGMATPNALAAELLPKDVEDREGVTDGIQGKA